VRDIVMVLGKAIGKQPRGQELPNHEDAVWAKLGPLGGVQFALEVIMKHTRVRSQGAAAGRRRSSRIRLLLPVDMLTSGTAARGMLGLYRYAAAGFATPAGAVHSSTGVSIACTPDMHMHNSNYSAWVTPHSF
jgi:hypothetical protein